MTNISQGILSLSWGQSIKTTSMDKRFRLFEAFFDRMQCDGFV